MNRSTKQWIVLALLALATITMIGFNGRQALHGLLWSEEPVSPAAEIQPPGFPPISFGIYDPDEVHEGDDLFRLEMIYVSWTSSDYAETLETLRKIHVLGRTPIVTIEPWPKYSHAGDDLLYAIDQGLYDEEIDKTIDLLNDFGHEVMISFAHEMDQDLVDRYPWSNVSPEAFQKAYQYFWKRTEGSVREPITWVWAPVAKANCQEYWPGDSFVDIVGMPIYSFPSWDKSYYGYIRSFQATAKDKVQYVLGLNKPLMIVEFGVTGGSYYQHYWLQEAFREFGSIPNIQSVVFFQSSDTDGAWGSDLPTPNWRTDEQLLVGLIQWYEQQVADQPDELQMQAGF